MNLFILRHAIALERGTSGYDRDSERPLTTKGEKRMYEIARGIKALDLNFDVILSSPYERAKRTAEIVAQVFKCQKKLEFSDTLAVGGDSAELIEQIHEQYSRAENILLVGHEPHLGNLIALLVTGDERMPITMKKGGLCRLSIGSLTHGQCASLEWLLSPRVMIRIR